MSRRYNTLAEQLQANGLITMQLAKDRRQRARERERETRDERERREAIEAARPYYRIDSVRVK